CQQHGESPLTF
nr:immunoglobulin light chain junction region [Macaca mulatta]MOX51548.1 immunoglobulin light chain junction region [Macaca mulatta]MOX51586.1 immunoglobulin light chain junction region [Macaca mulatta]MOX51698.1 immunoglobulin light chain junction region [Macaca mulatta]MOX51713.1 immunoglobulin light chain junction region [Macaca mulatta]